MENFLILEEITQTLFSTIQKCRNEKTKQICVLKTIVQKKVEDAPDKNTLRELLIMRAVNHPNVVY